MSLRIPSFCFSAGRRGLLLAVYGIAFSSACSSASEPSSVVDLGSNDIVVRSRSGGCPSTYEAIAVYEAATLKAHVQTPTETLFEQGGYVLAGFRQEPTPEERAHALGFEVTYNVLGIVTSEDSAAHDPSTLRELEVGYEGVINFLQFVYAGPVLEETRNLAFYTNFWGGLLCVALYGTRSFHGIPGTMAAAGVHNLLAKAISALPEATLFETIRQLNQNGVYYGPPDVGFQVPIAVPAIELCRNLSTTPNRSIPTNPVNKAVKQEDTVAPFVSRCDHNVWRNALCSGLYGEASSRKQMGICSCEVSYSGTPGEANAQGFWLCRAF